MSSRIPGAVLSGLRVRIHTGGWHPLRRRVHKVPMQRARRHMRPAHLQVWGESVIDFVVCGFALVVAHENMCVLYVRHACTTRRVRTAVVARPASTATPPPARRTTASPASALTTLPAATISAPPAAERLPWLAPLTSTRWRPTSMCAQSAREDTPDSTARGQSLNSRSASLVIIVVDDVVDDVVADFAATTVVSFVVLLLLLLL